MATDLMDRHCEPCEGGAVALSPGQCGVLLQQLHADWTLSDDGLQICREFKFPAYSRSLAFANAVAWIAIVEGHHPVISTGYGDVKVSYTTHAINGLSDNDFICAAKTDQLAAASRV
jgi:4a-hydroxytetrahydrobiopterin dehydratase